VPSEHPGRPAQAGQKSRPAGAGSPRTPEARLADHASIDRLVDELLPALAAKLGATELAEIEVREGGWKIRLRRPAEGSTIRRRASDRAARSQPGHEGHGHSPGALEGHGGRAAPVSSNGSEPGAALPVGPGRPEDPKPRRRSHESHPTVATSPAVGIYQPRSDLTPGTRVRAGDRIGTVNMLGVPQEVVAPVDGIVGASYAEPGDAVEYGQELVAIGMVMAAVDTVDGRPGTSFGGGA
jgi:biotin carboxyl carrier protein